MRVKRLFKGLILGLFGFSLMVGINAHAEEETPINEEIIDSSEGEGNEEHPADLNDQTYWLNEEQDNSDVANSTDAIINDVSNNDANTIKSQGEQFVEEYFGWIVGVPIGVVISVILEGLLLYLKKKNYQMDSQNMSTTSKNSTATLSALNTTNKLLEESIKKCEDLEKKLESMESNYDVLKESIVTIATSDKEMIKNGTAEKVCEQLGE